MSRISIEVTPEQHKSIKALALMEGVPMKELIWEMCEARLEAHRTSVAQENYGAGHDDCPICAAMGPNRRYNKVTEKALLRPAHEKNYMRFTNVEDAIQELKSE